MLEQILKVSSLLTECVEGDAFLVYDQRLEMAFKILQPAMNLIIEQTHGNGGKKTKPLFSCQIRPCINGGRDL